MSKELQFAIVSKEVLLSQIEKISFSLVGRIYRAGWLQLHSLYKAAFDWLQRIPLYLTLNKDFPVRVAGKLNLTIGRAKIH